MASKTTRKPARKKAGSKRRRAGSKRPVPGWVILMSGVLAGLLLAVFAYVQGWVPQPLESEQPVPGNTVEKNAEADVEDVSDSLSTGDRKKDYDFYTVLPEMEIVIPKEELEQVVASDSREYSYMLQVGSFKNLADAEKLKAKIAFSGQIAHIQSIDVNQVTWHRVRVGPFDSSRKADSVKRQLEKNNLNALMLKEAKESGE